MSTAVTLFSGLRGKHIRFKFLSPCSIHRKALCVSEIAFDTSCPEKVKHIFVKDGPNERCKTCGLTLNYEKCYCWLVVAEHQSVAVKATIQFGSPEPICECETLLSHDTACEWVIWAKVNGKWWR